MKPKSQIIAEQESIGNVEISLSEYCDLKGKNVARFWIIINNEVLYFAPREVVYPDEKIGCGENTTTKLYAKINELDAKIFWKFVKFEKENDCKVEWKNWDYDFDLKNLEVKSNAEIEAEKKLKVPETIEKDGYTYVLKN